MQIKQLPGMYEERQRSLEWNYTGNGEHEKMRPEK